MKFWSSEEIFAAMKDPDLRIPDNPAHMAIGQQLIQDPDDPELQELFNQVVQAKRNLVLALDDRFVGNYPSVGSLPPTGDFVSVGRMPTGDAIWFDIIRALSNIGIIGRTGAGKSSLIKSLLLQLVRSRRFCILAVDRKKELRHLAGIPELQGLVTVLRLKELRHSLLQPPPGVEDSIWAGEVAKLLAGGYKTYSSQRLALDKMCELMANRPPGCYPTVRELLQVIEEFRPRFGMREAGYKEAMVWILKDLLNTTGHVFDYSSSDLMERLFETRGLIVIEAETLPDDAYSTLITYYPRWHYVRALYGGPEVGVLNPVIFVLDDLTVAIESKREWETAGGTLPLTEEMFMGRGLGAGFIYAAHTFSISPKVLENTETMFILGIQGQDPRLIQNVLGTTPEQTEKVRALQPGEFIALVPSFWPKAVYGRFSI
jgi:hypothetical protein